MEPVLEPIEIIETLQPVDYVDISSLEVGENVNVQNVNVKNIDSKNKVEKKEPTKAKKEPTKTLNGATEKKNSNSDEDSPKTLKQRLSELPCQKKADKNSSTALKSNSASAPSNDEGEEGYGCYLTFSTVSEGTLFQTWSEKSLECETYAFFRPTKKVPKFKFKRNGGKSEIIRGFQGNNKRYYQGWTQFIKLAKEYQGDIRIDFDDNMEVYYLKQSNKLGKFNLGEFISLSEICAISVVPQACDAFDGVATMSKEFFIGTGNKLGASLSF